MLPNFRRLRHVIGGISLAIVLMASALPALAAGTDYGVNNGWFFSQTGGGNGMGFAVADSGTDSNGHPIKFWTEFRRLGGVNTLGYPVGEPYVGSDGFTYQPFQRALLQWRPELGQSVLANTFEQLSLAGKDQWLVDAKGVPLPIANDGSNGNYQQAVTTRLGWLTNAAIKQYYLSNPNPGAISSWSQDAAIQFYGLPMSAPEQHGPFVSQRFQRIAFQLWTDNVSGMPSPGTVVGVLGGDLLKEAGLVPVAAVQPLAPGGSPTGPVQPTPAPTAAPPSASTYYWNSTSVTGVPNCGTTYMYAYTRNAAGVGVNGMTLRSWNDFGNVYIASTRNYNNADGYWDRVIHSGVAAGTWYVEIVDGSGNQASNIVTVNFTASCAANAGNVQQVEIDFKSNG